MEKGNETKRFERKPNFDFQAKLSADGRYWILRRTETWILPRKYIDVIAQNHIQKSGEAQTPSVDSGTPRKRKRNADSNG